MTGLREAFDDIAGEIMPVEPPVELTMLRGRKMRNGRLAAAIGGTAGTMVIAAGAAVGFPALTGHLGNTTPTSPGPKLASGRAQPANDAPLMRPVLLEAAQNMPGELGNTRLVNAATLKLFSKLTCESGPDHATVNDHWKTALGYTAAQWNAPGSQVVSCDAAGTKYVLGPAVVLVSQVTSTTVAYSADGTQWVVNISLDGAAAKSFGTLTTSQYNNYYPSVSTNQDDAVLDSNAIVFDGDVQSAPQTQGALTSGQFTISGPQPAGFATEAEAEAFAARLR